MSRFQQENAVLLLCLVILYAEFKTIALGITMLIAMASFVLDS